MELTLSYQNGEYSLGYQPESIDITTERVVCKMIDAHFHATILLKDLNYVAISLSGINILCYYYKLNNDTRKYRPDHHIPIIDHEGNPLDHTIFEAYLFELLVPVREFVLKNHDYDQLVLDLLIQVHKSVSLLINNLPIAQELLDSIPSIRNTSVKSAKP